MLLARGDKVIGVDNLNDYYDTDLKRARLVELNAMDGFVFHEADVADAGALERAAPNIDRVAHLAAEAGVGRSFTHPEAFVHSNLVGFNTVAQFAIRREARHFVFASSSSVYGANSAMPYRETEPADHPLSFYAATKKANEAMAHALAHTHDLPVTGLRFFTVYGPWGRPDMSYSKFAERIVAGRPIQLHNHGRMTRDFTYVDDIAAGVVAVLDRPPEPATGGAAIPAPDTSPAAPYRIRNIGSGVPVSLADYVAAIENALGKSAIIEYVDMLPGEAPDTHADVAAFRELTGLDAPTTIQEGVRRYVAWRRAYYGE